MDNSRVRNYQFHNRHTVAISVVASFAISSIMLTHTYALSSSSYRFDETSVGTSGMVNSGSTNYSISEATGDLGVGESSSNNFQLQAGSKTNVDPVLVFALTSGPSQFGQFSASTAATTTASFTVKNYTSYGYSVQIIGTPPRNGGHDIAPMTTLDDPQSGKEQFGINLVANTVPTTIGANPVNDSFGFGEVSVNYNTPNKYRFVSGDTIAHSPKSSGVSSFTITYLVNVAGITPGGQYRSDQQLVVLATF